MSDKSNATGAEWVPQIPDVDPSTAGRGSYDAHIPGINVVNSIGENDVQSYSNKTDVPSWDYPTK